MRLRNGIMELIVCLVLIGLSVVGAVSAFVTGLRHDIDGLLLILVCSDRQRFFVYVIRSGKTGRLACPSVAATKAICGWISPHPEACRRGELAGISRRDMFKGNCLRGLPN